MIDQFKTRGKIDRVADLLARAPEAAEGDSRFWYFKGWVHEVLDELPDAEAGYGQALVINPLDWNARNRLAGCSRRWHDHREVERLTALFEQAQELRTKMRDLPGAERVTPEILTALSDYARKCQADWLAGAIDRTLGNWQSDQRTFQFLYGR